MEQLSMRREDLDHPKIIGSLRGIAENIGAIPFFANTYLARSYEIKKGKSADLLKDLNFSGIDLWTVTIKRFQWNSAPNTFGSEVHVTLSIEEFPNSSKRGVDLQVRELYADYGDTEKSNFVLFKILENLECSLWGDVSNFKEIPFYESDFPDRLESLEIMEEGDKLLFTGSKEKKDLDAFIEKYVNRPS